ncbi:hypothetical protein RQP46_010934 [Phenoliferia psychrophenolica]
MSTVARNLLGRNIIISGGANGIGKATALRLAAQGASLAISDLNEQAGLTLRQRLSTTFPQQRFTFSTVDVTSFKEVKAHVQQAAAQGAIAGLVCAAGIAVPGPRMHECSIESYIKMIDVNQHGTMYYNYAALAEFVAQNANGVAVPDGGWAIVNIGSKASVDGLPGAAAYGASKHALLGMSRSNAKDYALERIRINVLCPGVTLTELMQGLVDSGLPAFSEEVTTSRVAMKRFGSPEEMAGTGVPLPLIIGKRDKQS